MPVDMTSSPSQIFRTTQEGRNHVLFHFSIKVRSYAKSLISASTLFPDRVRDVVPITRGAPIMGIQVYDSGGRFGKIHNCHDLCDLRLRNANVVVEEKFAILN